MGRKPPQVVFTKETLPFSRLCNVYRDEEEDAGLGYYPACLEKENAFPRIFI